MARRELSVQLEKILSEYTDEIKEVVTESIEEVAKDTVEFLKITSPKGFRRTKKYASSWKTRDESGRISTKVIIYNSQGQLTHLLEFGHAMWFGGRARAIPHIAPAEQRAGELLEKKLIQKLT